MTKNIAIVGVGYVGINLAYAFSKKYNVIGYDINKEKINKFKQGIDITNEIKEDLKKSNIMFTSNSKYLKNANIIIIAVPTPINKKNEPDLTYIKNATKIVAKNMKKGTIVIYESTVAPGTTRGICKDLLEKYSDMVCDQDFSLGYSPERINPGDKVHTIYNSTKIVSATNEKTLNEIKKIYKQVIKKVHPVNSIEIAEAAKLIENTQRDINIAFMNQMVEYLTKINVPRKDVFDAMKTKWNALSFTPGLVGGHCISVDPYYLIQDAKKHGIKLPLLSSSRNTNEGLSDFIANKITTLIPPKSKIGILGFSYKKDSNDIRNTKVYNLYTKLQDMNFKVYISDYNIEYSAIKEEYNINFVEELKDMDLIILAVPHTQYELYTVKDYKEMFNKNGQKIIYDIYNILDIEKFDEKNIRIERM